MADQDIDISATAEAADVEMTGDALEDGENGEAGDKDNGDFDVDDTTKIKETRDPQTIFLDHLKSPIVTLRIAEGNDQATLTAHQTILSQSPWFAKQLDLLEDEALELDLADENLDAVGCFLQYQYTGEYFPRRMPSAPDGLETHASLPSIDNTGDQLLRHARVYTLAEKLGLPELKSLAHSKIHRINSTAAGEIAYARYVYQNTPNDDKVIRRPVANFWATRSHVLRHEAEDEFKAMCLEFPQFGFDVLSLVLDSREKRAHREEESTPSKVGAGSSRKRMRTMVNV